MEKFPLNDNPEIESSHKYKAEWCDCDNPSFDSYPQDGQCICGVYKHHVHCVCGKILQVG